MSFRRIAFSVGLGVASWAAVASERPHAPGLDALIAANAKEHGVPLSLMKRVIARESGFNPGLTHSGNFGLMQIRVGTARSMGYSGDGRGLLDPAVNLRYATPYLANAYKVAGGSEDRAVSLYSSGFYYEAKRRGLLAVLRKATSPAVSKIDPRAEAIAEKREEAEVSSLVTILGGLFD